MRILYVLGLCFGAALVLLFLGRTGRLGRKKAAVLALACAAAGSLGLTFAVLPSGNLYGPTVTHLQDLDPTGSGGEKQLALTFDDGPYEPFTQELLDVLREKQVRATFFLVASQAERHPDLVRRIVADGHTVGVHAWRHRDFLKLDDAEKRADLTRACQVLEGLTGRPVRYWRPPHGFRDPAAMQTARDLGLTVVTWSTAPRDWTGIAAGDIVQRVVNKAEPGAIVLLHDGDSPYYRASRQPTVDAAGPLIDTLRQQGYTLVPLADRK
ncbi:MAG: polysaccharide deacetylase family protein [Succiniclasticum sp.]|jgi:peptidoglycan/xylan/chitin deacetylase (PgdA/CDA1 family)|nr:polysaccharide deacetylase family protein [Succiniclasticum sp.]MEE3478695.1 polysaccharide deacetylase family protein [Succiniclasticum sp.]